MNIKHVFVLQVGKLGSCLTALSTQVGYIVPRMYEIYIVLGREGKWMHNNVETKNTHKNTHKHSLEDWRHWAAPKDKFVVTVFQWLKWFCEAGGAPDEARLEQTPYPFQPH